jgi:hypothetical protein
MYPSRLSARFCVNTSAFKCRMRAQASFICGLMHEQLPYGKASKFPEACKPSKVRMTESNFGPPTTTNNPCAQSPSCPLPKRQILHAPDVAILGNAGLAAYLTWPPTLKYLSNIKVRLLLVYWWHCQPLTNLPHATPSLSMLPMLYFILTAM